MPAVLLLRRHSDCNFSIPIRVLLVGAAAAASSLTAGQVIFAARQGKARQGKARQDTVVVMKHRSGAIDGWRGISIILVIIGHLISFKFDLLSHPVSLHQLGFSFALFGEILLRTLAWGGELGVRIFFVISGFLITSLLLAEEKRTGFVSITAFYVRRFCRIVPAFAVYLAAVYFLRSLNLVKLDGDAFLRSAAYICNFSEFKCSWWLAHTWSLSVEEQFYLVWPFLFFFVSRRPVALLTILIFMSVVSIRFEQAINFAHIAAGALYAASPRVRLLTDRIASTPVILGAMCFLLLHPLLAPAPAIYLAVIPGLPVLTAVVFFGSLDGRGPIRPLTELRPLQYVGLISYSLYLWQQIGTAPLNWNGQETGAALLNHVIPAPFCLFVLPALLSFYCVERPLIRLGHSISARILRSHAGARAAIPEVGT